MAVYFVRPEDSDLVKIGHAKCVRKRLAAIQGLSPVRLTLLREVPGSSATEKAFHKLFSHLKRRGEWFAYSSEMLTAEVEDIIPEVPDFCDPALIQIEKFLVESGLSATAFGVAAARDPRLVPDLRNGRELRRLTRERVFSFITNFASSPCLPTRAKRRTAEVV